MIPTGESKVQSRALKQRERQVSWQEAEQKQNDSIPSLSATGFRGFTQSLEKGIVPIQKQKVSDMQLTPFSIFSCVPHHLNALPLPAAPLYFTEILFQTEK